MRALNDVRQAMGLWKISRLARKPRETDIVTYASAKKIALLLVVKDTSDEDLASKIAAAFRKDNRECNIIGFTGATKTKSPKTWSGLLNRGDVGFDYLPKEQIIKPFLQVKPDILINLSTELCIPLAYISAISKSGFKIGKYHPKLANCYDFMLDSREATARGLFEEIMHYLYTIK